MCKKISTKKSVKGCYHVFVIHHNLIKAFSNLFVPFSRRVHSIETPRIGKKGIIVDRLIYIWDENPRMLSSVDY